MLSAARLQEIVSGKNPTQEELVHARNYIKGLAERESALREIAVTDGNLTLPVLIQLFDEIRARNEEEIEKLLKKILTTEEIIEITKKPEASDIFVKYAGDIVEPFKDAAKHDIKDVSEKNAAAFQKECIEKFLKRHAKLKSSPLKNELIAKLKLEIFLLSIRCVFVRADDEQRLTTLQVVGKYAGTKINPFGISVRFRIETRYKLANLLFENLIGDSYPALCDEVGLWISGLFRRTESLYGPELRDPSTGDVKKDKDGMYLPVPGNDQDEGMYKNAGGLTKIYMGTTYYKPLSTLFRNAIASMPDEDKLFYVKKKPEVKELKDEKKVVPVAASEGEKKSEGQPSVSALPQQGKQPEASTAKVIDALVKSQLAEVSKTTEAKPANVIQLPVQTRTVSSAPELPVAASDASASTTIQKFPVGTILFRALSDKEGGTNEEKIKELRHMMFLGNSLKLPLSAVQETEIASAVGLLKDAAERYVANAGYLLKKRHLPTVEKILAIIQKEISNREKLYQIIDLRKDLELNGSSEFKRGFDEVLLELFKYLTKEKGYSVEVGVSFELDVKQNKL